MVVQSPKILASEGEIKKKKKRKPPPPFAIKSGSSPLPSEMCNVGHETVIVSPYSDTVIDHLGTAVYAENAKYTGGVKT